MARETTVVRRRGAPPAQGRWRQATANGRRGALREVTLEDKYVLEEGRVLLTGVQALVRLVLDQHRADRRRGLTTGTMISGYQGSPLGGLDRELAGNRELLERAPRPARPGLNEELGATSVWGSQLARTLPGAALRRRPRHLVRQGARASIAPPTPCATATSSASPAPAAGSPWWATTRPPSLRRSRAPPSRCSRTCTCRPSSRATRPGGARPRPARLRLLPRVGPLGRLQDRHERRRRGGDRRRRPGRVTPVMPDVDCRRLGLRARAERQPAAAGVARAGAHAARRPHRARARATRARTASTGSTGGAATPGSASSPPARPYHDLVQALRALGPRRARLGAPASGC